jgi:hypothetical protein
MATLDVFGRRDKVLGTGTVQSGWFSLRRLSSAGLWAAQSQSRTCTLQSQAELGRCVAEDCRAAGARAGRSLPLQLGIEPNHQRSKTLE